VDLHLYFRVLWRFRLLVAAGILFATLLAFFSFVRLSFEDGKPTFVYRETERWTSRAVLLVTEPDFPLGRAVFKEDIPPAASSRVQEIIPKFAPSSRFIELATVYAQLATSDQVKRIIRRDGPMSGVIEAVPLIATNGTDAALPMISIGAIATTPQGAVRLAARATDAFSQYLETEQNRTAIPAEERVVLSVIQRPSRVELLNGRSKTLPAVVFITVLLAFLGLAFILENLRPRVRPVASEPGTPADAARTRRSA
jgi:hypothetical protein